MIKISENEKNIQIPYTINEYLGQVVDRRDIKLFNMKIIKKSGSTQKRKSAIATFLVPTDICTIDIRPMNNYTFYGVAIPNEVINNLEDRNISEREKELLKITEKVFIKISKDNELLKSIKEFENKFGCFKPEEMNKIIGSMNIN